ncbi:hypothetical protein [Sinimarinibacterium flocculans]|nr:hypothetical protein [Sinimarinibacterium flocculans]
MTATKAGPMANHLADNKRQTLATSLQLTGVGALAAGWLLLIYWPGLGGPFLFDDAWNLEGLAASGSGIEHVRDWLTFVLNGTAGPLGRPISLASFTLNSLEWPADPWPFKLTNLLIHLATSVLIYALCAKMVAISGLSRPRILAFACALLWATHPQNVSTVLYVVQRMTQLGALFTLAGLLCFVHGRQIAARDPRSGYAWICGGILGFGTLAALSKENGALLPLFALVLDTTVLKAGGLPTPRWWRHGSLLLLRLPLYLLVGYLAFTSSSWLEGYLARDFSLSERLASQGPVLFEYVKQTYLPSLTSAGIFTEVQPQQYPVWRVFWSWLAVALLIIAALRVRRRAPLLACGVLWFVAGHALESSVLPLELYFDHRNYLPSVGLIWIVPVTLAAALSWKPLLSVLAAIALLLSGLTAAQSRVWGDETVAATVWPMEKPDSLRALQFAIGVWQGQGQFMQSKAITGRYLEAHPNDPTALLHLLELQCQLDQPTGDTTQRLRRQLASGPFRNGMQASLRTVVVLRRAGRCTDLGWSTVRTLVDALGRNPKLRARPVAAAELAMVTAEISLAENNVAGAIQAAETAQTLSPRINGAYWQALWSLDAGDLAAAKRYASDAKLRAYGRFSLINNPPEAYLDALDIAIADATKWRPEQEAEH